MMQRLIRANPHQALLRTLLLRAAVARIDTSTSEPWASITFTGARHSIALRFEGLGAHQYADCFADSIDVAEFHLPGHILADINVTARRDELDATVIELEALTVEDA